MNIQRYDLEPGSESMQRFPDGDYVLHTDHLEAVEQARADALRLVFERIEKINSESGNAMVPIWFDGACREVRSIIKKCTTCGSPTCADPTHGGYK